MPNVIMTDLTYPVIYTAKFGDNTNPEITKTDALINTSILMEIEHLFPLQRNGRDGSDIIYPPNWEVSIVNKTCSPISNVVGKPTSKQEICIDISPHPYYTKSLNYILHVGNLPVDQLILNSSSRKSDYFLCELKVPYRFFSSITEENHSLSTKIEKITPEAFTISVTSGHYTVTVIEEYRYDHDAETHAVDVVKKLATHYGQLLDNYNPRSYVQYDINSNELHRFSLEKSLSSLSHEAIDQLLTAL